MPVSSARAGTNGFVVPIFRGQPGSEFAGWERFTFGSGTNNTPDIAGSTTNAGLLQLDPAAFVTGSGNIYNLSGASRFRIRYQQPFPLNTVVLQARTLGAELDYASVRLVFESNGTNVSLSAERIELDRGTAQGVNVSSKWEWDLSGHSAAVFAIEFDAAGPSLSFDSATLDVSRKTFRIASAVVDMDRWMYPFNATPGTRPSASVFGAFGVDSGVDSRDGQFLVGWNTSNSIPTGRGASSYRVLRARVTLTVNRDLAWIYDGTFDPYTAYLSTNDSRHLADADAGHPVEMFGAGFRNGFNAATFPEDGPFKAGDGFVATRNAFAAGYDTNGLLIDVSNNVGKRDEDAFEARPFAIGVTTNLAPGALAPTGTALSFDLDLSSPQVSAYLQSALDSGNLRLVASSLVAANFQTGSPNYPQFYTRDNILAADSEVPLLDLEVAIADPSDDIAPTLAIRRLPGGTVRVPWPAPAQGSFILEATTTLSGSDWITVTNLVNTEAGVSFTDFEFGTAPAFFRLRRAP